MKKHIRLLGAFTSLVTLLALPITGYVGAVGTASNVTAYLSPSTATVRKGENVKLALHVDGNGTDLNTVSAVVHFPASQLTFVGLDKSGSYFDTVIPAVPTATNGKLEFSAASLGAGSTSQDVLVETLIFSAKADSGLAQISLSGSQAANGGPAFAIDSSEAALTFATANGNTASAVTISGIKVTDVTTNNGVVHWSTDVPTSGSVDFGANTKYGLTANDPDVSTDHSVTLDPVFSGKTVVHFRVNAVDADTHTKSSDDQSFTTAGYKVAISVKDSSGKAVSDAQVSVAGGKAVATDANGIANISDVAPGNQKVTINGEKAQFIAVKSVIGKNASTSQQFNLVAKKSFNVMWVYLLLAVLIVLGPILFLRSRKKSPSKPVTSE